MIESSLQHEPVALPGRPFGRIASSVFGYGVLVALMMITLPLFLLVPVTLFHGNMRNGRIASAVSALIGSAIAVLMVRLQVVSTPAMTAADANLNFASMAMLILAVVVPSLLVLPLVERQASFGRVLMAVTIFGAVALGVVELGSRLMADFSPHQQQVAALREMMTKTTEIWRARGVEQRGAILQKWLEICLPAAMLMACVSAFVLSLVLFARIAMLRQLAEGKGYEKPTMSFLFRNLSLPDWLLFAFVAGGTAPLLSGMLQKIAANILAMVSFLYFLQGLAVFRALLAAMGVSFFGVTVGFMVMFFLAAFGIAQLPLAITGLFDSFFDFRKFKRKDHSDESHSD